MFVAGPLALATGLAPSFVTLIVLGIVIFVLLEIGVIKSFRYLFQLTRAVLFGMNLRTRSWMAVRRWWRAETKEDDSNEPVNVFWDFQGQSTKLIDGIAHKCCCASDVVGNPQASSKMICQLEPCLGKHGCELLAGPHFHSYRSVPRK